jgi:hypothetical protein
MPMPCTSQNPSFAPGGRFALGALALVCALWSSPPAMANTPEPALGTALQGKQMLSTARLRVWGFEVYDASLWTSNDFDGSRYAQQDFALELRYLREFKGSDIAERSINEMRELDSVAPEQAERWLAAMRQLFPDVKRGDRITGVHMPGRGAAFYLNGQALGELADERFSRLFFGIWLSPKTSQPDMRETLLRQLRAEVARRAAAARNP